MVTSNILNGRVILLEREYIALGPVFTGEIYPDSNGNKIISELSQVYSEKQFYRCLFKYARRAYGYTEPVNFLEEVSVKTAIKKGVFDISEDYESRYGVNWLYIKNINIEGLTIKFRNGYSSSFDVGESIACCNGKSIIYPSKSLIKTKDTLVPLVLIEKTT